MANESRFDDLDLREEPARGIVTLAEEPTPTATGYSHTCTKTNACTHICCTQPI